MRIDESKAKLQKAIKILKEKNVPKSIEWLMENKIGRSKNIELDDSKSEEDYENCQTVRRFTYNNNFYELFYVNGRSFHTYDDIAYMGDFRLIFNDELVLETSYSKNSPNDEWGSVLRVLYFSDTSIKSIKLKKEWVNDLPKLVEDEKKKIKEIEKEEKRKQDEEDVRKIDENIDLGDFE